MSKKRKAPKGCQWRGDVLYGRAEIDGREYRWTLSTDDPKVAADRRAEGYKRLIAGEKFGDLRRRFAEVYAEWAPWVVRHVSKNTAKRYLVSMGMLAPWLDGKFIDQVDGKFVATIIAERAKKTIMNATIKRDLVALSSVMKYAMLRGWADDNPVAARMKLVKERRDPIVLPQQDSIDRVIEWAPEMFADLIRAAVVTGARQEELASAKCSQLDLKSQRLTVIGKGNRTRVIDLKPMGGVKVFADLPIGIGEAFLFRSERGGRFFNVSSRFAGFCRELAADDPTFVPFRYHDLRHLHAVEYLRAGGNIYDLQKRLGHRSIKTTELYLEYLTPEEQRVAKGEPGVPVSVPVVSVDSRNVPYDSDAAGNENS